jgi:ABC-type bacteriocin/lantibiotic exporter with double-glycine peptidase domain
MASKTIQRRQVSNLIHKQRSDHDCGVAALASFVGSSYENCYLAAAAQSASFMRGGGLTINDLIVMANAFGRTLTRLDHRKVDLEEHVGILGVNWDRSMWKRNGATGHWVILRNSTIIDPSGPSYGDAADYLAVNKGRAGTLLQER